MSKLFVKVNGEWIEVFNEGCNRFSWLGDYSGQTFDLENEDYKYMSLEEYFS